MIIKYYNDLEDILVEVGELAKIGKGQVFVTDKEMQSGNRYSKVIKPTGEINRVAWLAIKAVVFDTYPEEDLMWDCISMLRHEDSVLYINPTNMPFDMFETINLITK